MVVDSWNSLFYRHWDHMTNDRICIAWDLYRPKCAENFWFHWTDYFDERLSFDQELLFPIDKPENESAKLTFFLIQSDHCTAITNRNHILDYPNSTSFFSHSNPSLHFHYSNGWRKKKMNNTQLLFSFSLNKTI